MRPLPRIMVAPNGARLQKTDHPALPITTAEIVTCALECQAEGAQGIHLHIRDGQAQHLLDANTYDTVVRAIKARMPGFAVQITTEAVGVYPPDIQMDVALNAGAEMVSVAIREVARAPRDQVQRFFSTCFERDIAVQHILYDIDDVRLLAGSLSTHHKRHLQQLLFVLGRYDRAEASYPGQLAEFVAARSALDFDTDWAVCAFGRSETEILAQAFKAGGKARIGFENSVYLPDGQIAKDNAAKVRALVDLLAQRGLN